MDARIQFAKFVLQLLEDTEEWNSDTPDEIAGKAFELGLAELGAHHQFKVIEDCDSPEGWS